MLFNSFEFILFLPIVFLLYWFVFRSRRIQNLFLVAASYVFYGWWDWRFLFLIAITSFCSYASGLLLEHYEEPKPHFNTLSTIVRRLEQQGYVCHKKYGSTYQYHALITEQDYAKNSIFRLVDHYIKDSYRGLVSTLLKEEKLSVGELHDLISQIETYERNKK